MRLDDRMLAWRINTSRAARKHRTVAVGIAGAGMIAMVTLGACTLVDQRTFAGEPQPPAPAQIGAAPDAARMPLISIGFDQPDPHYRELLRYAVAQAMLRRPDVAFDVVTVLPKSDSQTEANDRLARGETDAVAVARALREQGIPADRVILGARVDPSATGREVRVYVH